jgi:hypothetical protein
MYKMQDIIAQQVPNVCIDTELNMACPPPEIRRVGPYPRQLLRLWRS